MNRKWIIPVIAAAFMCTACAFLPKEEELPDAPVLRTPESEKYTQVAVARGDLVAEAVIECKYQPAVEEQLSFGVDGQRITKVYVSQGDEVKAGDLLLELDNTEILNRVDAQQETLDKLNLQITQTDEKLGLYYERCALLRAAGYTSQAESADRTCLQLYEELDYLKRLLVVEQMAMDELQSELSKRQVYATMDGTVRYVVTEDEGKTSMIGGTVCIVSDLNTGAFIAQAETGLFRRGTKVTIVYNGAEHPAKVMEITESAKKEGMSDVYFQLDVPDPELTTGESGKIIVVTDQREDVLYLPKSAVESYDNSSIVYYVDENGLRNSKVVETGLEAGKLVEIISGVEEGEMVIQ